MTKITEGQTLTARSACDYNCIFSIKVIKVGAKFATVLIDAGTPNEVVKRTKIFERNGEQYLMAFGQYSMAPAFYAN